MRVDRLLRLAEGLEADAVNPTGIKFDLGVWAAPAGSQYFPSVPETVPLSCGTAACALGFAAISGMFKNEGLGFEFLHSHDFNHILVPSCQGQTGMQAGARLFDISDEDASYLFDPDNYETTPVGAKGESFVARRIREFAAGEVDHAYHPDFREEYNED